MTTPLDRTIPATVLRLLATYGVTATFTTHTNVDYVVDARGITGAENSFTRTATPPVPVAGSYVDGTAQERSAFETWIGAGGLTYVPKVGDHVSFAGGISGTIVAADVFYSGDSVAAYRYRAER